jgi:hypothetical protein
LWGSFLYTVKLIPVQEQIESFLLQHNIPRLEYQLIPWTGNGTIDTAYIFLILGIFAIFNAFINAIFAASNVAEDVFLPIMVAGVALYILYELFVFINNIIKSIPFGYTICTTSVIVIVLALGYAYLQASRK